MAVLQRGMVTKKNQLQCRVLMKPALVKLSFIIPAILASFLVTSSIAENLPTLDSPALEQVPAHDPESCFQLARQLLKGDGMPKNSAKAFQLFKSAADEGHPEAMGALGFFYATGLEVAKNEAVALEWFRKGAEAGGPKAQFNYGKSLLESRDSTKAADGIKWLESAVGQNQIDAARFLGIVYLQGRHGQSINYQKSQQYLFIAAEAGDSDAQNSLGFLYSGPYLGEANPGEAQQWFRKAAISGNTKAQSNLGSILWKFGESDRQVRIEALAWLWKAKEAGEITADKFLLDISQKIDRAELQEAKKMASKPVP